jgi:two-component system response regulator NreC
MLSPAPSPTVLSTISIVLADDHRMVRSALRALLGAHEDLEVVSDAGDAAQALAAVVEHRPAVLVLDLNMPGELTALDAIPAIRLASPETAIVILTMQSDPGFARRTLELGATAYVLKDSADTELVDAVEHAAAGETYITSRVAGVAAARDPGERTDNLTPRELEVLRLIALGHTNTEIAARLLLSVRTVESHRAHIQKKLGRTSRAELVRYALDHHLLAA